MPNDPEVTSPQAPEGLPPEEGDLQGVPQSGPQGSQPTAQEGAAGEVDPGAQSVSSQGEPRPFERVVGRKLDKFEKAINRLAETLQRNGNSSAASSGSPQRQEGRQHWRPTAEDWKDPETVFNRMIEDRMQDVFDKIPQTLEHRDQMLSFQRDQQDALKMIKTNEAVKRDPEGIERIQEILEDEEFGLNEFAQSDPMKAAKIALMLYNERYGGKVKSAMPTKAQMISTATAVTPGGGKSTLDQEAAQLYAQVQAMPELMNDPSFRAKLDAFNKKTAFERMTAK